MSNNNNKNSLLDRIYDSGNNFTKFQSILNNKVKKKTEYKPVITADFGLVELKAKKNKSDDETKYQPETNFLGNTAKSHLKTKRFESKSKQPLFQDVPVEQRKNTQEVESITGFKTLSILAPSKGQKGAVLRNMPFQKTGGKFEELERTIASFGINTNLNFNKPISTIINVTDRKKVELSEIQDALTIIKQADENFKEEEEEKNQDDDKYMNNITKFIKEAFEGKDERKNFVYFLPSNKENYYDLKYSTYKQITNTKVYYTLSAKGLMVYVDKIPKEFIKLSEWIIEREGYNKISEIPFFKNFKIWRIIKIWRNNIFKQKKIAYQNELANKLLFNNRNYNSLIIEHKTYCNSIVTRKILDMKQSMESTSFMMFKEKQQKARDMLKKELRNIHSKCEDVFVDGLKRIFANVHNQINNENNDNNLNYEDNSRGKGRKFNNFKPKNEEEKKETTEKNKKDEALINDDNIVGFENYSYKNKMMIKNECMNFIKLAFVFDYILLDVLRRMFLFSIDDTLDNLRNFNLKATPEILKENVLNKKDEYVRPPGNSNKNNPYFLVKCQLVDLPNEIKNIDRVEKPSKAFVFDVDKETDFDPTVHIFQDPNEVDTSDESTNMIEDPRKKKIIDDKESIVYEEINNSHLYFISFSPTQQELIEEFNRQIKMTLDELKIKGWKGHPRFKKYLGFLGDWDDRFGDWDNDTARELDPSSILIHSEQFNNRDGDIAEAIKTAFEKCSKFLAKLHPYIQLHIKQKKIPENVLTHYALANADKVFKHMFSYTETNIKLLEKWIPFDEDIGLIKLSFENDFRQDILKSQNNIWVVLKEYYPDILRSRVKYIERWFEKMNKDIEGNIDTAKVYLDKNEAKDVLDSKYYFYEQKVPF